MIYGSVCSGIEAATEAWSPLGWKPAFYSEVAPASCAYLAHRYPETPNHGDMTKFQEWPDHAIDLLCGGTPCQSFSVAGLRQGLADPRGNLMLTYLAIAGRYRPRWLVWENVPGVLSSNSGRDFGSFLRGLAELGYHAAWRVLDAQFCRAHGFPAAVPQRRRRVFLVGYLGDWRRPAAVLFDAESLRGNSPPRRKAEQNVAGTIAPGTGGGSGHHYRQGDHSSLEDGTGRGTPIIAFTQNQAGDVLTGPVMHSLGTNQNATGRNAANILTPAGGRGGAGVGAVAFDAYNHAVSPVTHSLRSNARSGIGEEIPQAFNGSAVRRLTPLECERLMGFPDNSTAVPYRGKSIADGRRYQMLGNSWAVNCARIIGARIQMVEDMTA